MKPIPYFEKDGSYNEREHVKPKPREPEFHVDFQNPQSQLEGRMSRGSLDTLIIMIHAKELLHAHGALPGNRARAVEKQITLKARRCIKKYAITQTLSKKQKSKKLIS